MSDAASKLGYGVPKDTSVVVNRTTKEHRFLHNEYQPGDIATCTFPTGTEYIDTRRSFLEFEFVSNYNVALLELFMFGVHGSACNVFKNISIFARSGEELCRIEDFNLLTNMMLPLTYNRDWVNRQGSGMWLGDRIYASPQTCVIPMYILSPLFGYGRLLPAALVSGMRIELTLEDAEKVTFGAKVYTGSSPNDVYGPVDATPYSISGINFKLEVVKLGDSIRMAMDEILATKGVELVYTGWHHTFTEPGNDMQSGVDLTISDSYARALRAFARVRPLHNGLTVNSVHKDAKRDSFRGEHIFPIAEYIWRLGDRYYPDNGVRNGNRPIIESFVHTLNAVNQYDSDRKQTILPLLRDDATWQVTGLAMLGDINAGYGLGYDGFMPQFVGQLGSFTRDSHVIGVDLTRDSDDNISGRPTNNVEPLTLSLKCNDNVQEYITGTVTTTIGTPPLRRLDMFMQYAKLVRVFTNNVQVEK